MIYVVSTFSLERTLDTLEPKRQDWTNRCSFTSLLKLGPRKRTIIVVIILIAIIAPPLVYYMVSWSSVNSIGFQLVSVSRYPEPVVQAGKNGSYVFHVNAILLSHSPTMTVNLRYPTYCLTADSYNLGCIGGNSVTLNPNGSHNGSLYFATGFSDDPTAPSHFNQTTTSHLFIHMYAVTTAGWYNETINRDSTIIWTA